MSIIKGDKILSDDTDVYFKSSLLSPSYLYTIQISQEICHPYVTTITNNNYKDWNTRNKLNEKKADRIFSFVSNISDVSKICTLGLLFFCNFSSSYYIVHQIERMQFVLLQYSYV